MSGLQDATASANRTHDPQLQTRSNRGLYCRFYCLLNMFRGTIMPIIRSSRVLYSGCCLWYFVLWFSSCWSGVELRVMCPVWRMLQHPANRTHDPQLQTRCNRDFIADLIACSTCFGAPLFSSSGAQEYYTVVVSCVISSAPHQTNNLKTTAPNTTGSNHCIILFIS